MGKLSRRGLLVGAGAASGAAALGACSSNADGGDSGGSGASGAGATPENWPSDAQWQELNERVGGRLIRPVSPTVDCEDASGDECAAELKALENPFVHEGLAGATQSTGWLDAWTAAVSPYAVAATSAADISAAVDFARDNAVRLVVKGTGHDYLGRNNAPDSLLVWTHHMRNINLHDDFVPDGAPEGTVGTPALTVGAGTRWLEAYGAATDAGLYVQGGGCTSVGASGGFIQGSGFGSYSKAFGTGAGGVLQFTVVTADGKVRIANEHQNPDLFWALRGGGGSTFGIVASTTLLAHPIPTTTGTVTGTITATDDVAYEDLVRRYVEFYPAALNNRSWGEQVRFNDNNTVEVAMTWLDLTETLATSTWAPLLDPLRADPGRYQVDVEFTEIPFEQVWDLMWWNENAPDDVVADPRPNQPDNQYWWSGNSGEISAYWSAYESRWLPLSKYTDQPDDLVRMIVDASKIRGFTIQSNKGLSGADPEALARDRNTALHPGAFDAAALIIMAAAQAPAYPGVEGHEPDMDTAQADRDQVGRAFSIIREALPGQGAYANEASYFTEDWKSEFWGDNYGRLLQIKREVDPGNLFRVHQGVGSDDG